MKEIKIEEPQTQADKVKLARELSKSFQQIKKKKEDANWEENRILYFFDKFKLNLFLTGKPLSKNSCWWEIGIPPSTAQFKISLYGFYIVKHSFTSEQLTGANTKKLHRAIPLLKDKGKGYVEEIVHLATNREMKLKEFLDFIKI